jgi:hypothetical protein
MAALRMLLSAECLESQGQRFVERRERREWKISDALRSPRISERHSMVALLGRDGKPAGRVSAPY